MRRGAGLGELMLVPLKSDGLDAWKSLAALFWAAAATAS